VALSLAGLAAAAVPLVGWLADRASNPAAERGARTSSSGTRGTASASSYDDVYAAVADVFERQQLERDSLAELSLGDLAAGAPEAGMMGASGGAAQPADGAAQAADGADAASSLGGYSETNVQVEGVDEGDLVKTDGDAIYVARGDTVKVVAPDGAATAVVATLDVGTRLETWAATSDTAPAWAETAQVKDMLVADGVLAVLVGPADLVYEIADGADGPAADATVFHAETATLLWDVDDPAAPKELAELNQSGWYVSSRLAQGILYLVTNHPVASEDSVDPDDPATFVPVVTRGEQARPIAAASIALATAPMAATYAVATAVDLESGQRRSEIAVLGCANTVYLGHKNLYVAGWSWGSSGVTATDLARVSLAGGQLSVAAQTILDGSLLNQFSLDEHQGHLRVVTSGWAATTLPETDEGGAVAAIGVMTRVRLAVLDSDLREVGAIDPLVTDESVQSVRFMGDVGYVVTFKQVDPLFAIDLADPARPKVLSELKIPGFSAYLHPWGEGLLAGLGEDGTWDGQLTGNLKLSMFDVAQPSDVSEIASSTLDVYWSAALYDHRAILVEPELGVIGFAGEGHGGNKYLLYRYGDAGFTQLAALDLPTASGTARDNALIGAYGETVRGVRIGEELYVCSTSGVAVYTMDAFELLVSVSF
jgi:uncharacterized secreted protein with C-terminal beta-propeller domain